PGHSHAAGEEEESGEHDHSHDEAGGDDSPQHEHGESQTHQKPADAASRDPVAVVEAFHGALAAGSAAKVEALLDPKVLIMEGGNMERSRQEYASHHLPSDLKFMSAIRYQLKRQTGDTVGDLAWVASEATLTGESGGKAVNLVSTESLVLKKTTGGWKIVHIHWSSRSAKQA
ncbi:MAG: YybH family protein, partial [Steroidobacteraceae bacterium]